MSEQPIHNGEICRAGRCSCCGEDDKVVIAMGDATDEWTPSWVCYDCLVYSLSDLGKALKS